MMTAQINEEIGLRANYTFTRIPRDKLVQLIFDHFGGGEAKRAWYERRLDRKDPLLLKAIPEIVRNLKKPERYGAVVSRYHNLVPNVLRYSLATLISGTTVTPTFKANYLALGSGSTSPANGDTDLETETLRGTFTNRSALNNVATLDKFFDTSEVGGNSYNEAGVFVDGSASADSGYLLSRVGISETMGANETLTVNVTFTIT